MKVDIEVLQVLSGVRVEGSALFIEAQLDRKLYARTNKVLEAAGGKWNRSKQAHLFEGDASDRIEQILQTGDIAIPKDDFNFFPTPANVAKRVIELAKLSDGMFVLEPSAGRGALAVAAFEAANGIVIDMYELMEANNRALVDLHLPLSGVSKPSDFLAEKPNPIYDRAIMNPPFAKQADIKHVMHAHKFLKPGGLLVAVMSSSVTFRTNRLTQEFNAFVAEHGGFVEALPAGSFKASGTDVNTVIAVIPN